MTNIMNYQEQPSSLFLSQEVKKIPLAPEIQIEGISEGIFLINFYAPIASRKCKKCDKPALLIDSSIQGVVDNTGKERDLEDFSSEVIDILKETNKKIQLCGLHLIEEYFPGDSEEISKDNQKDDLLRLNSVEDEE